MFGMGFTEILMIAVVAIIFLGPDKLPSAMVKVARFIKGVKSALTEAKSAIDKEVQISQLKEEALSYKEKLEEATNELKGFKNFNQMGVDEAIEKIANSTPPQQSATQVEPKQSQEILLKRREESRDV
ncbi:MAG: Sec-independent protein translocase subunit TatB [Epsilonproteobacteria bacterium]|nr:Sec-independent protein translocase subunit TatB [Campylobacterota bacterium]